MTVVSYIYQDGTHSPSLCRLALYFLVWCLPRQFHLSVSYIPGECYLLADFLFKEGYCPQYGCQDVCLSVQLSGPLLFSGDRPFTSLLHVLLPKFCSCSRDPLAWRVDTISFPWSGLHLYVLPPFSMFTRVLERVVQDLAELALLAPFWLRRPWFPKLFSSCGSSEEASVSLGFVHATSVSAVSSKNRNSASLSVAVLSLQSLQSRLYDRTAVFSAEAVRDSTRTTYDSIWECFFVWCARFSDYSSSASLGQIAVFLVYLFDKDLSVSTIRFYRFAIASCHLKKKNKFLRMDRLSPLLKFCLVLFVPFC